MSNRINSVYNNRGNPLQYRGILFFIFLLVIGLSAYTFYKYFYSSVMLQGYSYLSDDLKNIEYIFENEGMSKDECLNDCQKDYLCSGLTYDATHNICYGLREGKLRSDDSHIFAWVKDKSKTEFEDDDNKLISWTKEFKQIPYRKIPLPTFVNKYAINFWFRVDDWYHNYALWRNIIYQGGKLEKNELLAARWSDIITNISKQRFGVWLAPYTNNVRVTIGTKIPYNIGGSDEHPANQICSNKQCYVKAGETSGDKYYDLEYMDIKNIEVDVPVMISLVFEGQSISIYHNGKLRQNLYLSGEPVPLNADYYIKHNKSYAGPFINLRVWDHPISSAQINNIYKKELKEILSSQSTKG